MAPSGTDEVAFTSLRRRLVAWAASAELVPLYAVYALLFEDTLATAGGA